LNETGKRETHVETFVLIHGAFSGGWTWGKVIPFLEKEGHNVIAPDMPGHGRKRSMPQEQVTMQSYVDTISEILDKQAEPVILVGHSMGGMIISRVAECRPEKIKRLIYVCAFLLKNGESLHSRGGGRHSPLVLSQDAFKELMCADCSDADVRWIRALMVPPPGNLAGMPAEITDKRYGSIPRYYIECTKDKAIPLAVQKQMCTDMPCKQVVSMNSSHFPLVSAPEELAKNLIILATN
jgi:pimeloyl-ACP methyl ester carboxylesterase